MSKTLYKKDSTGNIRYLKIWTEGADLVQESGVVGGNPVIHRKTCKGKNIGKSNETTPEKQAKSEMESKIKEKLKEDYFNSIEEAQKNNVILPMLAKNYKNYKHKIDWNNCYVQPKLDGMRCLAIINGGNVKLISREGTEITTVQHIVEDIKNQGITDMILDGELYCHGENFQSNMKLIKKYRPGETERIEYWIYDVVNDNEFGVRYTCIKSIVKGSKYLKEVKTLLLTTEEVLQTIHKTNLKEGFEGSMIRWGKAGYKINGRSENLLKYKDFKDLALEIKDIVPADARPTQGVPVFEIRGKKFRAGVKMSHDDREDLLTNKKDYIGKTGEIRFFEYTDDGLPRFPVMVGIRNDK